MPDAVGNFLLLLVGVFVIGVNIFNGTDLPWPLGRIGGQNHTVLWRREPHDHFVVTPRIGSLQLATKSVFKRPAQALGQGR